MSALAPFRVAHRLGLGTVVLLFGLMVLGSIVRTTGSGLACPDWPLCEGRLIPRFEFHVLVEWSHRLVALLTSLMLISTVAWSLLRAPLRARLGGLALLSVALLATQILLGALTVWKLLDPSIVGGHLGVALLLFATVLALTLSAGAAAEPEAGPRPARPPGLLPLCALTGLGAYAQAVLGGIVSANHAGLACPDWPTCLGEWLPPLSGPVGLQMLHRAGAYALLALTIATALRARRQEDPSIRALSGLALSFTLLQVGLGVANVLLGTPPWLVVAHLATAATILAFWITVTFRVASLPAWDAEPVLAEVR